MHNYICQKNEIVCKNVNIIILIILILIFLLKILNNIHHKKFLKVEIYD